MTTHPAPHIRWMIRVDMESVLAIDVASFGADAWGQDEYLRLLRRRNIIGMVAEGPTPVGQRFGEILGSMVYSLEKGRVDLLRVAVHPDHRRRGVGRIMLDKVARKLSPHRRTRARLDVPDDRTAAHLWLRACGWRAADLLRAEDPRERDVYRFELDVATLAGEPPRLAGWKHRAAMELGKVAEARPDLGPGVARLAEVIDAMPDPGPLPAPTVWISTESVPPFETVRVGWTVGGQSVALVASPRCRASLLYSPPLPEPPACESPDFAHSVAACLAWLHGLPAPPRRFVFEEEDRQC